jgi:D-alanyl-D-alanine carboxypeptidase/D-alanyl-D-alanine-endopeptidase (penicillin-binding protein 4)
VTRRAGNPIVVLVSIAVTVTMALLVLWQWADVNRVERAVPTVDEPADPTIGLTTPVLSYRRTPGTLALSVNGPAFLSELQPLLQIVGESSCVMVAVDGTPVASVHGELPVIPASNMKLLVAAAALDVLGADHRFTTSVVGTVGADGVVAGDLTLVGGGDPLLSTAWWPTSEVQTYPPTNITPLEQLADAVVAAGVTRVDGRIAGDGSRYDDVRYNPAWDESLRGVEGGPIGALLVDDGWTSASPDDIATDPALTAAATFTYLLVARGVTVAEEPVAAAAPADATEVASIDSAPMSAVVGEMLLTSDDNTAEMLVKELSVADEVIPGTTAAGLAVVMERLTAWGVPMVGLSLVDGSGLARDDRVTCAALMALLRREPTDGALFQGLPVAATSGTLTDEFVGSGVSGQLHAKTGSLSGVKSLSGWYPADGGSIITFAVVLNSTGIDEQGLWRPFWQSLGDALATYPSAVSVAEVLPR